MSTWKITPSRTRKGHSVIIGPYDDDLVAAIKAEVSPYRRAWSPGLKAWIVDDRDVPIVQRIIDRLTPGAEVSPVPLTIPEVVDAARRLGDDETHEAILDGVLLGVSEVYDQAEVADAAIVERDGVLLIAVAIGVKP